jgi:hypothetical protein
MDTQVRCFHRRVLVPILKTSRAPSRHCSLDQHLNFGAHLVTSLVAPKVGGLFIRLKINNALSFPDQPTGVDAKARKIKRCSIDLWRSKHNTNTWRCVLNWNELGSHGPCLPQCRLLVHACRSSALSTISSMANSMHMHHQRGTSRQVAN